MGKPRRTMKFRSHRTKRKDREMNKNSKADVLVGFKKTISFIRAMALMSLITIMESLTGSFYDN